MSKNITSHIIVSIIFLVSLSLENLQVDDVQDFYEVKSTEWDLLYEKVIDLQVNQADKSSLVAASRYYIIEIDRETGVRILYKCCNLTREIPQYSKITNLVQLDSTSFLFTAGYSPCLLKVDLSQQTQAEVLAGNCKKRDSGIDYPSTDGKFSRATFKAIKSLALYDDCKYVYVLEEGSVRIIDLVKETVVTGFKTSYNKGMMLQRNHLYLTSRRQICIHNLELGSNSSIYGTSCHSIYALPSEVSHSFTQMLVLSPSTFVFNDGFSVKIWQRNDDTLTSICSKDKAGYRNGNRSSCLLPQKPNSFAVNNSQILIALSLGVNNGVKTVPVSGDCLAPSACEDQYRYPLYMSGDETTVSCIHRNAERTSCYMTCMGEDVWTSMNSTCNEKGDDSTIDDHAQVTSLPDGGTHVLNQTNQFMLSSNTQSNTLNSTTQTANSTAQLPGSGQTINLKWYYILLITAVPIIVILLLVFLYQYKRHKEVKSTSVEHIYAEIGEINLSSKHAPVYLSDTQSSDRLGECNGTAVTYQDPAVWQVSGAQTNSSDYVINAYVDSTSSIEDVITSQTGQ